MKLTNLKIEQLKERLALYKYEHLVINEKLQQEYNKLFDADKTLQKDIQDTENASFYGFDKHGELVRWFKVKTDLSLLLENEEEKEFFLNYLSDCCVNVDFENECFTMWLGDDYISIQDDTRHDNGVWQGRKIIIDESEYKDESGEVDEEKRNTLIEAHMEKTGCFPGVFRVTQYGDVYLVNTTKKRGTK